MIRRPPRSTLDRSSAASDVYKRQGVVQVDVDRERAEEEPREAADGELDEERQRVEHRLSLIHISEPTRPY